MEIEKYLPVIVGIFILMMLPIAAIFIFAAAMGGEGFDSGNSVPSSLYKEADEASRIKPSGTFQWPADNKTITTNFSPPDHDGIDISGNGGHQIYGSDSGIVSEPFNDPDGFGINIIIDHQNGYKTIYGHLNAAFPTPGQWVNKGQVIAEMGDTGKSSGIHLHFEILKDGNPIDPTNILQDPSGIPNSVYIAAEAKTGTPWQIIKSIHHFEGASSTGFDGKCIVNSNKAFGPLQFYKDTMKENYTEDPEHPFDKTKIYQYYDEHGNPSTEEEYFTHNKVSEAADPRCDVYTSIFSIGKYMSANHTSNHNSWAKAMQRQAGEGLVDGKSVLCTRSNIYLLYAEQLGWAPPKSDNDAASVDGKDSNKPWRWGDPGSKCQYSGPDDNRQLVDFP